MLQPRAKTENIQLSKRAAQKIKYLTGYQSLLKNQEFEQLRKPRTEGKRCAEASSYCQTKAQQIKKLEPLLPKWQYINSEWTIVVSVKPVLAKTLKDQKTIKRGSRNMKAGQRDNANMASLKAGYKSLKSQKNRIPDKHKKPNKPSKK